MLALQRVILEKCQNINFWKLGVAGFHAILTSKPVQTSLQVDIEIYEYAFSQSQDRILSSHISIIIVKYGQFLPLTLCLLVASTINLCKQFGP